jgi:hypothetical protein
VAAAGRGWLAHHWLESRWVNPRQFLRLYPGYKS